MIRALVLALLLFPVGMATHEVMHLSIYYAAGYDAVLRLRPWDMGLGSLRPPGIHVAPAGGAPFALRAVDDFLGPALAAIPFAVLLTQVAAPAARAALLANALTQAFFALIEPGYLLAENVAHVEADILLSPWLNYGPVLVIMVLAATRSLKPIQPDRQVRPS